MVIDGKKKRGRPPKSKKAEAEKKQPDSKCKECEENISEDTNAIECDICETYICLPCAEITEEVYNFLVDKEVGIPFICKFCKEEIPKVRELMGLKTKYTELSEEVAQLKTDLAAHVLEIANYELNLQEMSGRLKALES